MRRICGLGLVVNSPLGVDSRGTDGGLGSDLSVATFPLLLGASRLIDWLKGDDGCHVSCSLHSGIMCTYSNKSV